MQVDLHSVDLPSGNMMRSQVCIVGAGIAGLTLAFRLVQRGVSVTLLEAGGRLLESDSQDLVRGAQLAGTMHIGTHEGRFRTLGGASVRWGGQLLPLPPHEDDLYSWPIAGTELEPFHRAAEDLLRVDALPYEGDAFFARTNATPPALLTQVGGTIARVSKWVPIRARNLADSIGRQLIASKLATVVLHAQAVEVMLSEAGHHTTAVRVRTRTGEVAHFHADQYVIAAGTVETSRLLLASRSLLPCGVGNRHDQVGRNFHDHLTLPAAAIKGPARAVVLDQLRPWVYGSRSPSRSTLHSIKLEASPALRANLGLLPVLAHLTLEEAEGSPMEAVRDLLAAQQRGDVAHTFAKHAHRLPAAALQAVRLAAEATVQHRRFVPQDTGVTLRLNAAQEAPSASRITLSEQLDAFGLSQPRVDWRIGDKEIHTMRSFAAHLRSSFEHAALAGGMVWNLSLFEQTAPLTEIEDARHAMGGACMGNDPRNSVVDTNLAVHGVSNLAVAGAATFPNGSPQLPTLTIMALALRLADRLAQECAR